ncbi:substance-K receptor-like [Amphiura filiformis]|uniref:substance-K receptor-like n=1 Tax=Amphiura filiformis TaxID=82378 RepID=UPI003B20B926
MLSSLANHPITMVSTEIPSTTEYPATTELDDYGNGTTEEPCFIYGVTSPHAQFLIKLVYSTTIILSVVGNALVICVLGFGGRAKTDLNNFLINLAVADLLSAIFCMPFTFISVMKERWTFGHLSCPLILFTQQVVICVSIFTLTAVGVDRYFAVVQPLKARMARSRTKATILGIWIAAILIGTVQLVMARVTTTKNCGEDYYWCTEDWPDHLELPYEVLNISITYVLPLSILCFTYSVVARKLWGRSLPGNADHHRDMSQARAKRKIIKMLMTIVVMFALCWLPLYLYLVFGMVLPEVIFIDNQEVFLTFYFCALWLAMSNSFINPIVYGFLNDGFRADVRRLLQRCAPMWLESIRRRHLVDGGRSSLQGRSSLGTRSSIQATRSSSLQNSRFMGSIHSKGSTVHHQSYIAQQTWNETKLTT